MKLALIIPILLTLAACSQPAPVVNVPPQQPPVVNVPPPPATYSINPVSGNNQVGAAGAAFGAPLVVQVVNDKGEGVPNVSLNVVTDARICSAGAAGVSTNAQGQASVSLTAGAATNVTCTTTVAINGLAASARTAVSFSSFVRPAQRVLAVPGTLALPALSVSVTDGATSSFALSGFSNLPALDADHVYAVYSFRLDPSTSAVACARSIGTLNAAALAAGSATLTMPAVSPAASGCGTASTNGSAATLGHNAVALALQNVNSTPSTSATSVPSPVVLGSGTAPTAAGTASLSLGLPAFGLANRNPFAVPAAASSLLVLESPFLAYNVYNSRFTASTRGLPVNPPGHLYAIYRTNAAGQTFRVTTFSVTERAEVVSATFTLPTPSNSTPPGQVADQKGEFSRVFVTLEPTSAGDGDFASLAPAPLVVLDTAAPGVWALRTQ